MDFLYHNLLEPWTEIYFQRAMLGGCLVALAGGVVGCFVVLRRMAFLGDGLAHAMLPGIAIGYLVMKLAFNVSASAPAMLLGSLIAAVITVGMIGFVSRASRIKEDAAIGIMYTGAFALGGLIVSLYRDKIHIDLIHFLMGDVLAVSDTDLWLAAMVTAGVVSTLILFYRSLQLASFDRVMAAALGLPVVLLDYLLTVCTSLVVVSGVNMVGLVLVIALLITPAATAYLLCDRLSRMLMVSALVAVSSVAGGLYAAVWLGVSGAAPIVLCSTLQFLVVLVVAPRHGLLARQVRLWRAVPQQMVEKILRSALRGEGQPVPLTAVAAEVQLSRERLTGLARQMENAGLLALGGDQLSLTEAGTHEARRILRAHRLWETYLAHVGANVADLHRQAERLQHVNDEASVDYLDDKLGHPLRDPHGAEIPEDFVHVAPGLTVCVALLREGHRGVVQQVSPALADRLRVGQQVRIGPRREDDRLWTVETPGGELLLSHAEADGVQVRVE